MRLIASCLFLITLGELPAQLAAQAEEAPAMASVQIINATSVPVLSLRINETLAYDTFSQGQRSGDAALPLLEATYEAEDRLSGTKAKSERITYAPGAYQSLVIVGDFSRTSPPGVLRQPGSATYWRGSRLSAERALPSLSAYIIKGAGEAADHQRNARQTLGVCECKE